MLHHPPWFGELCDPWPWPSRHPLRRLSVAAHGRMTLTASRSTLSTYLVFPTPSATMLWQQSFARLFVSRGLLLTLSHATNSTSTSLPPCCTSPAVGLASCLTLPSTLHRRAQ